jgi:hypothetical protein
MMTKEMAIDSMWWRSKEEGDMEVKLSSWPTAHWSYDEDKIIRIGLMTDSRGIINKVKVCGHTYEIMTEIDPETEDPADSPVTGYVTPIVDGDVPEGGETLFTVYNTFIVEEDISSMFDQKWAVDDKYIELRLWEDHGKVVNARGEHWHYYKFQFQQRGYKITNIEYRTAGDVRVHNAPRTGNFETTFWVFRKTNYNSVTGQWEDCAGGMSWTIRGWNLEYQPPPTPEEYENAPTSAIVDNSDFWREKTKLRRNGRFPIGRK